MRTPGEKTEIDIDSELNAIPWWQTSAIVGIVYKG